MNTYLDVGLTGGIACGKSLVLSIFKALGCSVLDADKIYHGLIEHGKPLYKKLVREFGEGILNEEKDIDRSALGKVVFNDDEKRRKLNQITHPAVIKEQRKLKKQIRKKLKAQKVEEALIITDAALMIEAGTYKNYDKVIVVASSPEVQIQRLVARENVTEEEAKRRIDSQMSVEKKTEFADFVIDNNGTSEELIRNVEVVHAAIFESLHEEDYITSDRL